MPNHQIFNERPESQDRALKELQAMGYRVIHFSKHKYFYVYEMVDDETILIAAVYHELQDYGNLFKNEMNY